MPYRKQQGVVDWPADLHVTYSTIQICLIDLLIDKTGVNAFFFAKVRFFLLMIATCDIDRMMSL